MQFQVVRLGTACHLPLILISREDLKMQREVLFSLGFVVFAMFAPQAFEFTVTLLMLGSVAALAAVGIFFVGKETIEKPDSKGGLIHSFRVQPISTAFNVASMLGFSGFAIGLFFAFLGFEPTTESGTKLWLISGGFGAAFIVCAWGAAKVSR
jgi:hypothetical protein